jgi:hypothetical protein
VIADCSRKAATAGELLDVDAANGAIDNQALYFGRSLKMA